MINLNYSSAMVASVPVKQPLKLHFIRKYETMVQENGLAYAMSYFKDLRLAFMRLMSHRDMSQFRMELHDHKIRMSAGVLQLVEQAKAQPHVVLNFLKFPTGDPRMKGSEEKTYKDLIQELATHNNGVGGEYYKYLTATLYSLNRRGNANPFRPSLAQAFVEQSPWFYKRMKGKLRKTFEEDVTPHMYADSRIDSLGVISSQQWEKDYKERMFHMYRPSKDPKHPVGAIHLVKKGVDDFRAVAVPNRYLQQKLGPLRVFLAELTRRLGVDNTFDQSRSDKIIQRWIDTPGITPYGVDIHHATNTLPFTHGEMLVDALISVHRPALMAMDLEYEFPTYEYDIKADGTKAMHSNYVERKVNAAEEVITSWRFFRDMAKAYWSTPYGEVQFNTGQPLGTWGSFSILNMQNALYAETAVTLFRHRMMTGWYDDVPEWRRGNMVWDAMHNQTYAVLGDDIVFKHEELAQCYIDILNSFGVPLSLHKSFKGNLVEFAGKIYIKGQKPRYVTDHRTVTWSNLFDWSEATGIPLKWNNLPQQLRRRVLNRTKRAVKKLETRSSISSDKLRVGELLPPAFDKAMKLRSNLILERQGGHLPRKGWDAYFQLILDEIREQPLMESKTFGGFYAASLDGEPELFQVSKVRVGKDKSVPRLVPKPEKAKGRPDWKNQKWVTETTDIMLASAVLATESRYSCVT